MCGISGIIGFNQPICSQLLSKFNNALIHRGPDNQSTYISKAGNVGLGHCRLSIVDLSSYANQPFLKYDNRYSLVFNGEIYNYLELREELRLLGESFTTDSDTEVVLTAFHRWGPECLRKLNGMWAFAVWDNHKETLFLARDRFGVKPLYYCMEKQFFAFSSEQRPFRVISERYADIDQGIASASILNPPAIEAQIDCIYHGVKRVLPGQYLILNRQILTKIKWWDTYTELDNRQEMANSEELFSLFSDACRIRLRTDVDIACTLSGGIDSSVVTSQISQMPEISGKRLTAFTGGFSGTNVDESHFATIVAQQQKIAHKIINVNEFINPEFIQNIIRSSEDISFFPAAGQGALYQAINKAGYKVSLEGHGGDELLGGYPSHLNAFIGDQLNAKNNLFELAKAISALKQQRQHFSNSALDIRGAVVQSNTKLLSMPNRASYLSQFMPTPGETTNVFSQYSNNSSFSGRSLLFQKLYFDFHYLTLPSILRNYDRASMANSVEIRSPFLDYRFVLAAFSAPDNLKISNGISKKLFREDFALLPKQIKDRTDKSGFSAPFIQWLKEPLREWLLDLIHDSQFRQTNLFDGNSVSSMLSKSIEDNAFNQVKLMWPIISLYLLASKEE